jgi:methionine synthase I (cobalamin-dependent)
MTDRWLEAIGRDALILDAAMGTRLIERGLRLDREDPAHWNLSRPEIVGEVHRLDAAAGADVLLTNTFGANRAWLSRYHPVASITRVNRRAVALARSEAGPLRRVLGSIGPTADDAPDALREQVDRLLESGVDGLLFETHRLDQAVRALGVVRERARLPLLVSLIDWPSPIDHSVQRLADLGADAIGTNCQPGMEAAVGLAKSLRSVTPLPLIVKPSAGAPGGVLARPASFGAAVAALRSLCPVLIGGCCGTTEDHVAALRAACYDVSR